MFCVIDLIQTPDPDVRTLSKWGWPVRMILLPWVGCIGLLVTGRPARARPPSSTLAPGTGFPERQRPPVSTADIEARPQESLEAPPS